MKNRAAILAVALSIALGDFASAELMYAWTHDELFSKSDFVVIAEPISAIHDTNERSILPELDPSVPAIGVLTDFKTLLALKGQKQDRFVLHHYRLPESDVAIINGPVLVKCNPRPERHEYLLFLVRERDGQFVPVGGQAYPGVFSVKTALRDRTSVAHKSPNQSMKPTSKAFASRLAPLRNQFSELAATSCPGLPFSR
jgi:hypothetical protein